MAYTSGGTIQITTSTTTTETIDNENVTYAFGAVSGDSTQSSLGNPMYIDCELGECYKYESGTMVLVNSSVTFIGNKLPVLSAGSNTITYDNTITEFKITPRWWQI
jgi:phage-related protein